MKLFKLRCIIQLSKNIKNWKIEGWCHNPSQRTFIQRYISKNLIHNVCFSHCFVTTVLISFQSGKIFKDIFRKPVCWEHFYDIWRIFNQIRNGETTRFIIYIYFVTYLKVSIQGHTVKVLILAYSLIVQFFKQNLQIVNMVIGFMIN